MTAPVVHAYDWSITTGVAVAVRRPVTAEVATRHLTPVAPPSQAAGRLWHLYCLTVEAARWAHHVAPQPVAAYWEQAFGTNMRMLQAAGVVQAGLWEVGRAAPFAPNVWPLRTTEWRRMLGLARVVGGTADERRAMRKQQQRAYAITRAEVPENLTEDEYDAVCVLLAAEADLTSAMREAA